MFEGFATGGEQRAAARVLRAAHEVPRVKQRARRAAPLPAVLALSILAAGALAGCGGSGSDGGGQTFPSVDPLRWSATPSTLSFGTVLPGASETRTVTFRNSSVSTTGTLTSVVMPTPEFTLVGAAFPVVVAPGGSG